MEPSPLRTIVLAPSQTELERVGPWLEDSALILGIDPETVFKLNLCIEEWVTNVVHYAHVRGGITLEVSRSDPSVVLAIIDGGPPFDPTVLAAPPLPESLDDATIGGQGIHLMKSFSSSWSYAPSGPRGNVLTLRFDPSPAA